MAVTITQSRLRPVLTDLEAGFLQTAISACAPGVEIECELYSRPFSGCCNRRGSRAIIRVATLDQGYPLTIDRFIGPMCFPERLSAVVFLAMHEAYHLVVPGLDCRTDALCDSVAFALQNDLGISPPQLIAQEGDR